MKSTKKKQVIVEDDKASNDTKLFYNPILLTGLAIFVTVFALFLIAQWDSGNKGQGNKQVAVPLQSISEEVNLRITEAGSTNSTK